MFEIRESGLAGLVAIAVLAVGYHSGGYVTKLQDKAALMDSLNPRFTGLTATLASA